MDIELHIGPEHCHATAFFKYRHYTSGHEEAEIHLYAFRCPECKDSMIDAEDYANILEHELIELYCSRIMWEDTGKQRWDGVGFNNAIRFAFPKHKLKHQGKGHYATGSYG